MRRFKPGEVIVERGVFFDTVWIARPMTVVEHTDDVLAAQLMIGTNYFGIIASSRETIIEEFTRGETTWGDRTWTMFNVINLVRPDDPYSIQGFFRNDGSFAGWYVNLQDPMRPTMIGYDTRDHALDIVIGEDLTSWMWKDEDELDALVELGLYTEVEGDQIRRNGEAVIELVETGKTWWGDWQQRPPDQRLPVASMPDGWDKL